jgi:hypothetical protein
MSGVGDHERYLPIVGMKDLASITLIEGGNRQDEKGDRHDRKHDEGKEKTCGPNLADTIPHIQTYL